MEKFCFNYIVIRILNKTYVIFEDQFLNNNEFYTQNVIIDVLSLLYDRKDFDVELCNKVLERNYDQEDE